jgi:hypothetical protein
VSNDVLPEVLPLVPLACGFGWLPAPPEDPLLAAGAPAAGVERTGAIAGLGVVWAGTWGAPEATGETSTGAATAGARGASVAGGLGAGAASLGAAGAALVLAAAWSPSGGTLLRRAGIALPADTPGRLSGDPSREPGGELTARPIAKQQPNRAAHRTPRRIALRRSTVAYVLRMWIQRLATRTVLMTWGRRSA